ncbi:hypothetical protein ACWCP6_05450 [Streptomyces sp. NPDC002004]
MSPSRTLRHPRRSGPGLLAGSALVVALLVTGCGHSADGSGGDGAAAPTGASSASTPASAGTGSSSSDLARMQKLLDGADSAVSSAESDAAKNG